MMSCLSFPLTKCIRPTPSFNAANSMQMLLALSRTISRTIKAICLCYRKAISQKNQVISIINILSYSKQKALKIRCQLAHWPVITMNL